jgi:hypothetical protein
LHDRIAKKKPAIASCTVAICIGVTLSLFISFKTTHGRAFCCFVGGSLFLNALYCLDKRMLSRLSSSQGMGWVGHSSWRPMPDMRWYLWLFLQPRNHNLVPRISSDAEPWRKLQWVCFTGV